MYVLASLGLATLLALPACASFQGNLNYDSPSKRHPNMGINVPVVSHRSHKRGAIAFQPSELNFTHGVASGDPYPDSVILWTRVAPSLESSDSNVTVQGTVPLYNHDTEQYIQADANPVCVDWKVMQAAGNSNLSTSRGASSNMSVSSGRAYTTGDIDYTIKVEATGLRPFTAYNYQFTVCGSNNTSPVGLTKTAPAEDADIDQLKFAVFSCSNYPNGYFNPYGNAARKAQHDYVVHLGDYIYESAAQGPRAHIPPRLLFSLFDYRTRHGQYRTDPDLQLLSQDFAWIATWDDHEVANNGYRDGFSGLNNTEESFRNDGPSISVDQRKMNAVRAYFEWMPIRQVDMDDNLRIWRNFKMGKLMDFIVLDTRNYDRSITTLGWNNDYIDLLVDDASRTLMGSHQENWFYRQLSESAGRGATWRVIGNQIIFSRIIESFGINGDNWNHLYDNNIGNNIFLAGDSHQNWVSDLVWLGEKEYDDTTGAGALGVEFAGTAVSSTGNRKPINGTDADARARIDQSPVLQWQDGYYRGYFVMSVGKDRIETQFFGSPSVATRNAYDLPLANFTVLAGDNRLSRPVAGGSVESGGLRGGEVEHTNLTLNTVTGEWEYVNFDQIASTGSNPIVHLATETGTPLHRWNQSTLLLDSEGRLLATSEANNALKQVWEVLEDAMEHSKISSGDIHSAASLYTYFETWCDQALQCGTMTQHEAGLVLGMSQMWGAYVGDRVEVQSLKYFYLEDCIEGEDCFIPTNYEKIMARISSVPLTQASIQFNTTMACVEALEGGPYPICLTTSEGKKQYFDDVVVTTPLGWLKKHKESIRPLHPRIASAIEAISFGRLEKVLIEFPTAFWAPAKARLKSGTDDTVSFVHWLSPSYASATNPDQWRLECVSFDAFPEPFRRNLLLFYTFGDCSTHITTSIRELQGKARDGWLERFFEPYYSRLPGYSKTCAPLRFLATEWGNDEFAGNGSYSNFQVGMADAAEDVKAIRHGMPEQHIWFAGEHTAPFDGLGTVAGAYTSGEHVARRILDNNQLAGTNKGKLYVEDSVASP
ncbi:MAG: hypothetical protein LQ344_006587 [Seirophora lacunosa]|nr:MAG: hypothetical protein LQ344_006587 [Seirophora lacunosa]